MLEWIEEQRWEAASAAPVWHELRFGCSRLPPAARRRIVETYLDDCASAVPPGYDERAAEWHAVERARPTGEGQTPGFVDGPIAAVAAVHQLAVVTLDASQFRPFVGLKIEEIRGDVQVAAAEGRRHRGWQCKPYGRSHRIDKRVLEDDHVED